MGIFEDYAVASWTVRGDTVYFAVIDIDEQGGNRIVRRPRPYRDGSKLDDTGSKEKEWDVVAIFNNDVDEDGLPTDRPAYPNSVNVMIDSADLHDTGTLGLPNRGAIRARLETYRRSEKAELRDTAMVTFHFVGDNEDNVDAQSFTTPHVGSSARQIVAETVFSSESLGGFTKFLADLEDAADKLQDAMAAPGEAVQDVDQKAARVVRLVDSVERQFTVSGQLARDLLTDPDSWATWRQLHVLKDTSMRAVDQKSALGRVITISFETTRSLFDIAAEIAQDPASLLDLNTQLDNALRIPAGTIVRVFES
jgi:prophage DNA circulation protein